MYLARYQLLNCALISFLSITTADSMFAVLTNLSISHGLCFTCPGNTLIPTLSFTKHSINVFLCQCLGTELYLASRSS